MTKDTAMRLTRPTALLTATAFLVAACSSSSDTSAETLVQPTSTEAAAPTETTVDEPAGSSTSVPAPQADPAAATEAWLSMWEGVELVSTDAEVAKATIQSAATEAVFDQLNTIYNPSIGSDVANSPRTFENNPVAVVQDDGSVSINDCIFESPKVGNATIWYSGVVRPIEGGWEVDSISLESEIGCVPVALAEAAIGGYEDYWDARVEFWDPADPSSELVDQTITGQHRVLIERLLLDHQARGLALRGSAEIHPEVIEVRSATEIAVLDCKIQDPERGLYVIETGERLDDIPEINDGQRDLNSAVLIFEDGVWKVSDVQGQADVQCDTAPTTQGLPVV